jgi:hypothetical protein
MKSSLPFPACPIFCLPLLTLLVLAQAPNLSAQSAPDRFWVDSGQSIPGFGDTRQRLDLIGIGSRWEIPIRDYSSRTGPLGLHHHALWLEPGLRFMLPGADNHAHKGIAFAECSFLGAFVFGPSDEPAFFITIGGGPTWLFGEVSGMGSDLNGHYQLGAGWRGLRFLGKDGEVQLRYHHVSNLGRAKPNDPLNSLQLRLSWPF